MDGLIDFHAPGFDQVAAGFVVALRFDALHFAQQLADEFAHFTVVVDFEIGIAVARHFGDDVFGLAFFENPACHGLAIAHVGLFDIFAGLDAA